MTEPDDTGAGPEAQWVSMARRAYEASTSYLNSEIRTDWERSTAHFQNRHAPGSKFLSDAYKKRSKVFRPKTRMAARSAEAALAAAMFSTSDLVDIQARDDSSPEQMAGAAVAKALLQYRLENTIPWFLTVIGAFQDAYVYKICASYQYWHFHAVKDSRPALDANGQPLLDANGVPEREEFERIVTDKPCVEMIPPENIRFDPACDWRDPVASSPYLIRVVPMYLDDVMARMAAGEWLPIARDSVRGSTKPLDDSTRREREHGRPDPAEHKTDNPLVWVHQNFIRRGSEEWVFWTLGTTQLLSVPRLLKDIVPFGERPIVIGRSVVEAHRPYGLSPADLIGDLQVGSNEVTNQRFDNVQLVLNKRYIVRRGKNIDLDALMRNTPGSGVMADDPIGDVRVMDTPDVTGSSYQEQDRFDIQIDEMAGSFSQGTVGSNRALGDTVGGMRLASSAASAVSEYTIRTFVETWVEPVLRQLVKLEQAYESDEVLLALAGREAQLAEKYGQDQVTDAMLSAQVVLRVNVGIGATNPQQKVERLMMGVNAVSGLPGVIERLNAQEIMREVFGALGYKNGDRFLSEPQQTPARPPDPRLEVDMRRLDIEEARVQADRERHANEIELRRELGFAQLALKEGLTLKQIEAKLAIDLQRDQTLRDTRALTETNRQNEMDLKRSMGSGI